MLPQEISRLLHRDIEEPPIPWIPFVSQFDLAQLELESADTYAYHILLSSTDPPPAPADVEDEDGQIQIQIHWLFEDLKRIFSQTRQTLTITTPADAAALYHVLQYSDPKISKTVLESYNVLELVELKRVTPWNLERLVFPLPLHPFPTLRMVSVSPSPPFIGPDCTPTPATRSESWENVYPVDPRILQIDSVKRMNLDLWRHVLGRFSDVEITRSKIVHKVLAADHFYWVHNFTVLRLANCLIEQEVLLGIIDNALVLEELRLSNLQVENSYNQDSAMRRREDLDDPALKTKLRVLELVGMDSHYGISPILRYLNRRESIISPFELDVMTIRSDSEYGALDSALSVEIIRKNNGAKEITFGEKEIQMILDIKDLMPPPKPLAAQYLTFEVSALDDVEAFLQPEGWLRFLPHLTTLKIVPRGRDTYVPDSMLDSISEILSERKVPVRLEVVVEDNIQGGYADATTS
ncbi:uncharacterized protein EV420DRAFT_646109 [Desarmillaria tabescens]|uniref:Uncharacterized protein n=1 Tax=Armillaria tabescens TaxID=1929756 RepID=A0AA39NJD5_ARMTA|nr:uncharacterized protein EV420DRAFT_646109 [Desarmillaria tabescens]KAK0466741.1 hypothetical protein EV420DRAFT_646109 [Desarmillaria tabescens]